MTDHIAPDSEELGLPRHHRPRQQATVWQTELPEWRSQLQTVLGSLPASHTPAVFFRADDIGAGGCAFEAMCRLFNRYSVPLALSIVPAWLSATRRDQLFRCAPKDEPLWCWHQHGWRHVNWQRVGKKSEFGEQRPFEKQWRDIWQGQQKMLRVFGSRFTPVFTPPWNRLSVATVKILQELGFAGVSLAGPLPRGLRAPVGLSNLRVHIDLHTRKGKDATLDFQDLLESLQAQLAKKEPCGIMIHHHRMNFFAFEFLHELIDFLKNDVGARFLSFRDLLDKEDEED